MRSFGEDDGQRAATWAHFEDDVLFGNIPSDDASGVWVFEEVLAEAFFGEARF